SITPHGLWWGGRRLKRPNITPRKQEIQDMVTVLEAPHENAQAAAKAAIKQAYNILFDREWWTIAERGPDGTAILLGAWPTLDRSEERRVGNVRRRELAP